MTIPFRALIEIGAQGSIEASPFARMFFTPTTWPDGTTHARTRDEIDVAFTIEREPDGWIARTRSERVVLVAREAVRLHGMPITLRPGEAPLVRWRPSGRVHFIDAPYPLTDHHPRRLGVLDGRLVEVVAEEMKRSLRPDAPTRVRMQQSATEYRKWVALDARFDVPLRWLVDRGASAPINAALVDDSVVDLAGTIRRVPLAIDELFGAGRSYPRAKQGPIHAGVVAGFFPERLREWNEIEEQVAMLP